MSQNVKPNVSKLEEDLTETIDNRQSVKQILAYLRSRGRKLTFNTYLKRIMFRSGKAYTDTTLHFAMPGIPLTMFDEKWNGELPSGFFEEFSHRSHLPAIITKDVRNCGKQDPVTEIMKKKNVFKKVFDKYKLIDGSSSKLKKKIKWTDDNVLHCPEYMIEGAKLLENEPEKYFNATYNWYYAGKGNLQVFNWYGTEYLIHAEFNNLFVTPFFKETLSIDHRNSIAYELDEGMNILEAVQSLQFIALRTLYKIVIIKIIQTDDGLSLDKIKEIDSIWQFTGVTFDEYHKCMLYLTTLEWQLTIVNLDRMKCRSVKLRGKYTTLVDNWSSVIGSERGTFVHINRKSITMYDKRTNDAIDRWKSLQTSSDLTFCNYICSGAYCTGRPQMYVNSTHQTFLIDMRHVKTSQNRLKPVQRWMHGMKVPPCYISICENKEYNRDMVCTTSQWPEDMMLLSNHSDILARLHKPSSVGLPYRPPSIIETYFEARNRRLCCDLYNPIDTRLLTAISGLKILQVDDNDYKVLMLNSFGDITCHNIHPLQKINFLEDDSPERLHDWSKSFVTEDKTQMCSYIYDVHRFWKDLKKVEDINVIGWRPLDTPRHKYSEEQMHRIYEDDKVDMQFLEIWKENQSNLLNNNHDKTVINMNNTNRDMEFPNSLPNDDNELNYDTYLNINNTEPMDVEFTMPDDEF